MNRIKLQWFAILILLLSAISCKQILPKAPKSDMLLDGPVAGLNAQESQQHLRGDFEFNTHVFTAATGLGPVFAATSCGSCHVGDGKGHPSTALTRFGQTDSTGNHYLDKGGPLLQHRAIPGYSPEVLPQGVTYTRLIPPIVSGTGFIELVSDADIMAMEDPYDIDADGISGRANRITLPSYITPVLGASVINGKYISRFGKKASTYNLFHQTVTAYNQDIGITSFFNPLDAYSLKNIDPEISNPIIYDVIFYLQTLKAPEQRNQNDAKVIAGRELFIQIGCASCHKTRLKTGYSPIEALSNKEFYPYTDLLLHDMGQGLNDNYTEGMATVSEWRTAALWGLGLAPESQGGSYYLLHDGRAGSIEAAISYHGGEAASRRDNFYKLSREEKDKVLAFLNSL